MISSRNFFFTLIYFTAINAMSMEQDRIAHLGNQPPNQTLLQSIRSLEFLLQEKYPWDSGIMEYYSSSQRELEMIQKMRLLKKRQDQTKCIVTFDTLTFEVLKLLKEIKVKGLVIKSPLQLKIEIEQLGSSPSLENHKALGDYKTKHAKLQLETFKTRLYASITADYFHKLMKLSRNLLRNDKNSQLEHPFMDAETIS
jgi:hypothetical protein